MNSLTAIVVDDERLARRELTRLLTKHPVIDIVGEASSVEEAAVLVRRLDPDVVFLDIQMPRQSGFELLEAADVRGRLVFVTAHDVHALRAFEVNALDYLLKPVHPARLAVTVSRLTAAPEPLPPSDVRLEPDDHLFLAEGRAARFVRVRDIVCLRGAGDYASIFLEGGKELLSSRPLKEWEGRLPSRSFVRVHRAAIVNLDHVARIERAGDDTYCVHLRGQSEPVPMSRRYAARLRTRGL
jgi:two-component system, LytTR family, response regulator